VAKSKNESIGKINVPAVAEGWTAVTSLLDEVVPVGAFICNWDIEDPDNAPLLFLAEQPTQEKSNDLAGKRILVKHWICIKKRIPDKQSGGECDVVSSVLISPTNELLSTMSVGVLKSIELLRRQRGTGPLDPPIAMVIMASHVGPGSDMLTLVPEVVASKK